MGRVTKKLWAYLLSILMVFTMLPITEAKAEDESTMRFRTSDLEKATISYQLGEADFVSVSANSADPGGNVRVTGIALGTAVVVQVLPNEGVNINEIEVFEGEEDGSIVAYEGNMTEVEGGFQYSFIAQANRAYSLSVSYNDGGQSGGAPGAQDAGLFRFQCQSNAVNGGNIYYKLDDAAEFTKVAIVDNNYDAINVASAQKITIKMVPEDGYLVDAARGGRLKGDNSFTAQQMMSNDGICITLANYVDEGKTIADSYYEFEFGFESNDGHSGGEGGIPSWDKKYVPHITRGFNLVSEWIGSSKGDVSYAFSDDDKDFEGKVTTITRNQMEQLLATITSEDASKEDINAAKDQLFGLAITGRYLLIKAGKDVGGDKLGFDIFTKDSGENYHNNDEKRDEVLKYFDYESKEWKKFDSNDYRWEEYLKGDGYFDASVGRDVTVDGLILDLNGMDADDAIYCHLPFDSRKSLSWKNAKYEDQMRAAGDVVWADEMVENGSVELIRVASEDGEEVYYSDEPNWKPNPEIDPNLVVEIGRQGYDHGYLRPGYMGAHGKYTAEEMLEAANKASGECRVPDGSIVTVKLTPDAGYQVLAAKINGMPLTPDANHQSQFSFKITSNIHFLALFDETKDVVDVSDSASVSAATVTGTDTVIDAGNIAVTVEDDKNYNTTEALKKASGTAVASLDVDVEQIVAKAGNLSEEEQRQAKAGTLAVSAKNFWTNSLAELSNSISISLTLEGITVADGESLSLVRDHKGICEAIPVTISTQNGKTVASFKSDKFSTYTFVKKSAPVVDPKPEVKKGSVTQGDTDKSKVKILDLVKKEVSYVAPANKTKKEIKVPATIRVNGVKYKVTKIEDKAFSGNKRVTKVTLPTSIVKIGKNAFNGCSKLNTIALPKNVTEVGENAFKGCSALTKMTVPAKVTKIGANAFNGCKKMKTITIKTTKLTAKKIAKNAFKGLSRNVKIKVPKNKLNAYQSLFKSKGFRGKVTK